MRVKLELLLDDHLVPIQASVITYDDLGKRSAMATRSLEGLGMDIAAAQHVALRLLGLGVPGDVWDAGEPE